MKNKTTLAALILVLTALAVFIIIVLAKPDKPAVGEGGLIKGSYSLNNVMSIKKPYRCNFELKGEDSQVAGVVTTNGADAYQELRMLTPGRENFTTFILIKNKKDSYIWTSLYGGIGYQTRTAGSAVRNASPAEQAQIVGLNDKVPLECSPWQNPDNTVFDVPSWVTFSKI